MPLALRLFLLASGAVSLVLTVGFFLQAPWATAVWPWPASRLSCIFLSSIAAAIGVPVLWLAGSGQTRAMEAGALDLAIMFAGMTPFAFFFYGDSGQPAVLAYAIGCVLLCALNAALAIRSRGYAVRDPRPMPALVRISFAVFATILVLVAIALIAGAPHVFPWPLPRESSIMFGWIFIGAAVYFAHGVLRPSWSNACGQLAGFLAYDLILMKPYVQHFKVVKPAHALSLKIYVGVLVYSGLLAVFYLVLEAVRARRPH